MSYGYTEGSAYDYGMSLVERGLTPAWIVVMTPWGLPALWTDAVGFPPEEMTDTVDALAGGMLAIENARKNATAHGMTVTDGATE